ncbi:hypothetical protein Pen01_23110 [Phytomonospora endophytica]|nr:hypothetical protein Pen01_23110 [Phytomonospora endophytica]
MRPRGKGLVLADEVTLAGAARPTDEDKLTAHFSKTVAIAQAELARADLKAQALLAGTSAVLIIGIAALDGEVPVAARIAGWGAAACAFAAVVLLTWTIRPYLGGRFGLMKYARMSVEEIVAEAVQVSQGDTGGHGLQAEEVRRFAWLARRKYRIVQRALDLLIGAGGLGAVAVAITILSGH